MDGTGEVTAYKLKNIAAIDPWNEIIVVHCPFAKKETLKLPDQKQYLLHCDPLKDRSAASTVSDRAA